MMLRVWNGRGPGRLWEGRVRGRRNGRGVEGNGVEGI